MAANIVPTGIGVGELAEVRGVRERLQWFTREKSSVSEAHLQLCRIPSPTFLEGERAAWFVDRFRAAGWNASLDRARVILGLPPEVPADPLHEEKRKLETVRQELAGAIERIDDVLKSPGNGNGAPKA